MKLHETSWIVCKNKSSERHTVRGVTGDSWEKAWWTALHSVPAFTCVVSSSCVSEGVCKKPKTAANPLVWACTSHWQTTPRETKNEPESLRQLYLISCVVFSCGVGGRGDTWTLVQFPAVTRGTVTESPQYSTDQGLCLHVSPLTLPSHLDAWAGWTKPKLSQLVPWTQDKVETKI